MLSFLDNELQLPFYFLQISVAAFGHLVNFVYEVEPLNRFCRISSSASLIFEFPLLDLFIIFMDKSKKVYHPVPCT